MVALLRGEAIDTLRAADLSVGAASEFDTPGLNPSIELVTLGFTTVLLLPEPAAGGTSLNVTTPLSSTDLYICAFAVNATNHSTKLLNVQNFTMFR